MEMKKSTQCLIILTSLLAGVAGIVAWFVAEKQRQRQMEWPYVQVQRGKAITDLCFRYNQQTGFYPESLRTLIDSGLITSEGYRDLMFQESPRAKSRDWQYYRPVRVTERRALLFSGHPIFPWKGAAGMFIMFWPDGSGVSFSESKLDHYMEFIPTERTLSPR
jgi:hypothetical protein